MIKLLNTVSSIQKYALSFMMLLFVSACTTLPDAQVNEKSMIPSTTIVQRISPLKMEKLVAPVTSMDPMLQLPQDSVPYVDKRSLECMAKTIYWESKSEPVKGQIAVGHVILNRTKDPRFPNTVCGVVTQSSKSRNNKTISCQFHWYCDGRPDSIKDQKTYAKMLDIARLVLSGQTINPVGRSLFFHATYVKPQKKHYLTRTRVGNHIFYT